MAETGIEHVSFQPLCIRLFLKKKKPYKDSKHFTEFWEPFQISKYWEKILRVQIVLCRRVVLHWDIPKIQDSAFRRDIKVQRYLTQRELSTGWGWWRVNIVSWRSHIAQGWKTLHCMKERTCVCVCVSPNQLCQVSSVFLHAVHGISGLNQTAAFLFISSLEKLTRIIHLCFFNQKVVKGLVKRVSGNLMSLAAPVLPRRGLTS